MFPPLYPYPGPPGYPGQDAGPYFDGRSARNTQTSPYLNYLFDNTNNLTQMLPFVGTPQPMFGAHPPSIGYPPSSFATGGFPGSGHIGGYPAAEDESLLGHISNFLIG